MLSDRLFSSKVGLGTEIFVSYGLLFELKFEYVVKGLLIAF